MSAFNLSEWALRHRQLVWFFLIVVLVAGTLSYLRLGRAEDPAFTFKVMLIEARWPGASIEDTLEQVTDRLERKLQETPGLDFVRSFTVPGRTMLYVNLRGDVAPAEVADTWYQVRKKIGDIRQSLPQGVLGPFFNDEFGDTYGLIFAFTSDGFSHRELREAVEGVRSRLLGIRNVSKADLFGVQDEKIYLEFSVERLAGLSLNRRALIQALREQNFVAPAGIVQGGDEKVLVQIEGAFESERDVRRVNFSADGKLFRLSDIANVRRGYVDPPAPSFRVNGEPAIGLGIAMAAGGDIIRLGNDVGAAMADIVQDLPLGIEPHLVADQPEVVVEAVDEFTKALWEAVAIVLAISFLSLGVRAGAVVACSIPLVLAAVFIAMDYLQIDLQRISLGALIIALGLLVDDAMITVETMVTRLEHGWDKVRAATYAYSTTAFPMLTGTLVTALAFVPVGFARSDAGEYTFSLFAVVAVALLISWVVAVVFAPLIGAILLSERAARSEPGVGRIGRAYRGAVVAAMRWRWLTILLTLALMGTAVFGLRFVSQQFFPASDRPELVVDLRLSEASSIYATDRAASELDALLRDDPDVLHWTTYVGSGAVRFYLPLNVEVPNDFLAQAVIVTNGIEARERLRARLETSIAERIPNVVSRLSALELGPPIGWPLQYRVTGPDIDKVRQVGFLAADVVAAHPATHKVNFDWMEPVKTLRVDVDQDRARLLGISSEQIATFFNAVVSGLTVTQVRDGIYLVDVIARGDAKGRVTPAALRVLPIPLPGGGSVPLMQIATVEFGLQDPLIWRRQRVPTLTVQADVVPGALPESVARDLAPKITDLNVGLDDGYSVVIGGAIEKAEESRASVAAVLPIAGVLMLVMLMIQLQSFQRMFLVLSVAPFGLVGVVAAMLLSGKPLGFVALLGVIALVGMIIRNSVILIDQIDTEIANGLAPWDAVVEASSNRFRPILLTAAAMILAMIPIAPTVFWGPMAYAIAGGLAVATLLTLLFLPALYVAWFRVREAPTEAAATG